MQEPLISKWHRELALFSAVKPLLILEGNITDRIRISSQDLSNRAAGVYHLTIWVMNKLGDVSTVTVPVIVREDDPAAPVVELKSYLTYLARGEEFDPKAYFQSYYDSADSRARNYYDHLEVSGEVDTDTPGTYEVVYSATNSDGLTGQAILTVVVEEKMEGQS